MAGRKSSIYRIIMRFLTSYRSVFLTCTDKSTPVLSIKMASITEK